MRHLISTLSVVMVLFTNLSAASLIMDYCRFKGENGRGYIELYMDVPRQAIVYKSFEDKWVGALNFNTEIIYKGDPILRDSWTISDMIDDLQTRNTTQRIVDTRIYKLKPGQYTFNVIVEDSLSETEWEATPTIDLKQYSDDSLSISDIELASHMLPGNLESKFSRGEITLIPNPRRIYGTSQELLYYYFEIYPRADNPGNDIMIERTILNGTQDTVSVLPAVIRKDVKHAISEWDSLRIDDLSSGSYELLMRVSSKNDSVKRIARKKFFIYNPEVETQQFEQRIDSAEVVKEIKEIGFLMSSSQRKTIERMNIKEKAAFLDNFWRLYDDDPSDEFVPLRSVYRDRIKEADARWDNSRNPGHKTDRGRIYVLYGEYDSIERHQFDLNAKPYEIWTYDHVDGGAFFVFVDRSGLGEYDLVHSTKRGEVNNPDWYTLYVKRSGIETGR